MRLHRIINVFVLLLLGILFSAANLWYSAARSTIPLQIDARVLSKEVRREKHPGKDDVYMLQLEPGGFTQVDRPIYEAVQEGDLLQKASGAKELMIGASSVKLQWSTDFLGMKIAMPSIMLVLLIVVVVVLIQGRRHDHQHLGTANLQP